MSGATRLATMEGMDRQKNESTRKSKGTIIFLLVIFPVTFVILLFLVAGNVLSKKE